MTMHKNGPQISTDSKVEAELRAALERLKEKTVNGRPARISYRAVALEAGRSRTLIGLDACAYPEVRQAVAQAIEERNGRRLPSSGSPIVNTATQSRRENTAVVEAEPADPYELIVQLKSKVASLTKQNAVAAIKIVTIDDENQQLRDQIARLKTELARRKAGTRT